MKKTLLLIPTLLLTLSCHPQTFPITPTAKIIIEKGDITHCKAQAIVNAANKELQGGAGVCGAIFKAAGWQKLQAACDHYLALNGVRCPTGSAKITDSFDLKTRGIEYIIHAVGPDCRVITDMHQQNDLLYATYKNSLLVAEQNSITSLAFPFISSGIYGFDKDRAARIALESIIDYLRNNHSKIIAVHIVLYAQDEFDLFCRGIQESI